MSKALFAIWFALTVVAVACSSDDGGSSRSAGAKAPKADEMQCRVKITKVNDVVASKDFTFKAKHLQKQQELELEGTLVTVQLDNKSGKTDINIINSAAEISGQVSAHVPPGGFLALDTLNDFGGGDGSDSSVMCKLGGKFKKSKPTKVSCVTKGPDDKVLESKNETIPADFNVNAPSVDITVSTSGVIEIVPEDHLTTIPRGFGTKAVPMRFQGITCFVE